MRPALKAIAEAGALTTRLRLYEMSGPRRSTDVTPGDGNDLVRQVGIKIWSDGSPWIGNVAPSFPYLDTRGHPRRSASRAATATPTTRDQISRSARAYSSRGGRSPATPTATTRSRWCSTRGSRCWATIRAPTTVCASSTSAPCGPISSVGPPAGRHVSASSSTTCTTGATSWSTTCSVATTEHLGRSRFRARGRPSVLVPQRRSGHPREPAPEHPRRRQPALPQRPRGRPGGTHPGRCGAAGPDHQRRLAAVQRRHHRITAPGAHADLVVFSANPLKVDPATFADLEVRATVFAGKTVHGSLG